MAVSREEKWYQHDSKRDLPVGYCTVKSGGTMLILSSLNFQGILPELNDLMIAVLFMHLQTTKMEFLGHF